MIKIILVGVWVCAVTLGTVYFSVQHASAPTTPDDGKPHVAAEHVPGELVTVPMIGRRYDQGLLHQQALLQCRQGEAEGNQDAAEGNADKARSSTFFVGAKMIDIPNTRNFELATFKAAIKDG